MDFADYKCNENEKDIQQLYSLISSFEETDNDDPNHHVVPIKITITLQKKLNQMLAEFSLLASHDLSKFKTSNLQKKKIINNFFFVFSEILHRNGDILHYIQNEKITDFQMTSDFPQKFTFLSPFLFTNLILHCLKDFSQEFPSVLDILIQIDGIDQEYFNSLFKFHPFMDISSDLLNILKTQYLSDNPYRYHIAISALYILTKNVDLFHVNVKDCLNFNLLFQEFILKNTQILTFDNEQKAAELERLVFLHTELNKKILFRKSDFITNDISKYQMNSLIFFVNLALKLENKVFDKVIIQFLGNSIESEVKFDVESFLNTEEIILLFLNKVFSHYIIDPEKITEINPNISNSDLEMLDALFDFISSVSSSVDSLSEFLSRIFVNFLCGQLFYSKSLTTGLFSDLIKENCILTLANITTITGNPTDLIVSESGFLEDVIEQLDESSFMTKLHICVIFSNLLFESSPYFDTITGRIGLIGKLAPLIWSSTPQLHKVICGIFLNMIMNTDDEGLAASICFRLKEEGIFQSLATMLDTENIMEVEDKSYIFELSDTINRFIF